MTSPSSLSELQRHFQSFVISGFSAEPQALAEELNIRPNARMTALERINIYRDVYQVRLFEAVAADFPVFGRVVGTARFERAVRNFFDRFPSRDYNLNRASFGFADFCKASRRFTSDQLALAYYEEALIRTLMVDPNPALPTNVGPDQLILSPTAVPLNLAEDFLDKYRTIAADHKDRPHFHCLGLKSLVMVYQDPAHFLPSIYIPKQRAQRDLIKSMMKPGRTLLDALSKFASSKIDPEELTLAVQTLVQDLSQRGMLALKDAKH